MMTAYVVIVEEDDRCFEEERQRMIGWIKERGGKYLVRGAPSHIVEGDLDIRRVVLIEYETVEDAKAAFESGGVRRREEGPARTRDSSRAW